MMKRSSLPETERLFQQAADPEDSGHTSVVVLLDGSERSAAALSVARTLTRLVGGMLHVVHAQDETIGGEELARTLHVTTDSLQGAVVNRLDRIEPSGVLRIAGEREGALIVLSSRADELEAGAPIGPLVDELIRTCPVPLVLVPSEIEEGEWTIDRVLMPHDGTPTTAAAFSPSVTITKAANAELIVLHSVEARAAQPSEPGTFGGPQYIDQPQHEWPAWADEFLERLGCIGCIPPGVRVRLVLATGSPGHEIVKYAAENEVDLIVIAWQGRWQPHRAKTVRAVIEHAPCPVVLLRTTPR